MGSQRRSLQSGCSPPPASRPASIGGFARAAGLRSREQRGGAGPSGEVRSRRGGQEPGARSQEPAQLTGVFVYSLGQPGEWPRGRRKVFALGTVGRKMGPYKVGVPGDRLAQAWRPEDTPQSSPGLATGTCRSPPRIQAWARGPFASSVCSPQTPRPGT